MTSPADNPSSLYLPQPPLPLNAPYTSRVHYYPLGNDQWLAKRKLSRPPKVYQWHHNLGNGWIKGKGDLDTPLYASGAIEEAKRSGRSLFIVEGEKDVESLLSRGYLATTLGSASAETPALDKLIKVLGDTSINLYLIPDYDQPTANKPIPAGLSYSRKIFEALEFYKGSIYFIDLGLTEWGADVSDYLDLYNDRYFEKLIKEAPKIEKASDISFSRLTVGLTSGIVTPEAAPLLNGLTEAKEGKTNLDLERQGEIIQLAPSPAQKDKHLDLISAYFPSLATYLEDVNKPKALLDNLMYRGQIVLMAGGSGVGKSLLALDLALLVSRAGDRVAYLDYEMNRHSINKRLRDFGVTPTEPNLFYHSQAAELSFPKFDGKDSSTQTLIEILRAVDPALVVIDTFSKGFEGTDSDKADQINSFFKVVKKLQKVLPETAFLIVDHLGKNIESGVRAPAPK